MAAGPPHAKPGAGEWSKVRSRTGKARCQWPSYTVPPPCLHAIALFGAAGLCIGYTGGL
jgi:hypothetical protein